MFHPSETYIARPARSLRSIYFALVWIQRGNFMGFPVSWWYPIAGWFLWGIILAEQPDDDLEVTSRDHRTYLSAYPICHTLSTQKKLPQNDVQSLGGSDHIVWTHHGNLIIFWGMPKIKPIWGHTAYVFSHWSGMTYHMGVSWNRGTPKSSILIGFSLINPPFGVTPIYGNPHIPSGNLLHGYWQWPI